MSAMTIAPYLLVDCAGTQRVRDRETGSGLTAGWSNERMFRYFWKGRKEGEMRCDDA